MTHFEKILIIRFSSFGDVVQTLSVPTSLKERYKQAQVHWVTRQDMSPLLNGHPHIDQVYAYQKKSGLSGLFKLALQLRQQNYTHVYDAHNNLRSRLITLVVCPFSFVNIGPQFIRRSIRRWKRFLLFKFRVNTFEMPFSGQRDLLEPLSKWGVSKIPPPAPQMFIDRESHAKAEQLLQQANFTGAIALAPSAAFFLKRWPKNHWVELIKRLHDHKFILLGGPEDSFLQDIADTAPLRTLNLAGKCSLQISAALVQISPLLISNDTGLLHVAEQLGVPAIALMGPAPFGFPSRANTQILQRDLACRPCSKHGQGPCVNKNYHECLASITPSEVENTARRSLKRS